MEARYKILFSGDFKGGVSTGDFIYSFSKHLSVDRIKAAKLLLVDREVILKRNLSELETMRHMAAFEKMGMIVTKKLMMKEFVGPRLDPASMMDRNTAATRSKSKIKTLILRSASGTG